MRSFPFFSSLYISENSFQQKINQRNKKKIQMINNISLNFSILKETPNIPIKKILDQFVKFPSRRRDTKQMHGFNSSPNKTLASHNFYIMTDYQDGTELVVQPDGSKKRRPKYKMLFDSMDGAFQLAKVQRQVFAGLNHNRRDILVVDIDKSYPACFSTEEMNQRINTIFSLCDDFKIDHPNYIEFHKDSGHCQIGWYLTEFFINYREDKYISDLYKYICKVMARLMNADEAFTGGNIKNPYHEDNEAFFFNKTPHDTKKLITQIYEAALFSKLDIKVPEKKEVKNYKEDIIIEPIEIDEEADANDNDNPLKYLESGSRNVYGFGHTRTWVYRYMRDHGGSLPSKEVTFSIFKEFEYKSLTYLKKDCVEPDSNIRASAVSILKFCADKYNPEIAEAIKAQTLNPKIREERRYSSIITRQAKKALRVLKAYVMFSKGMTQKQIAEELGCTQPTVHNLLKEQIGDAVEEIKAYLKFKKKSTSKKTRVFSDQLWEELTEWGFTEEDIFEVAEKIKPSSTNGVPVKVISAADLKETRFTEIENKTRGDPDQRYIISV